MALRFLSVDIETTGLEPRCHGITEFAAVNADTKLSSPPKSFYRWLNPEGYVWSNYCLRLHEVWIDRVTYRLEQYGKGAIGAVEALNAGEFGAIVPEPPICMSVSALIDELRLWLCTQCDYPIPSNGKWQKLTPAGKNFGSFDKNFLEANGWPPMFRHRALDPTAFYFDQDKDDILPELKLCKERAMAQGCSYFKNASVAHNALEDAFDVAKLLWFKAGCGPLV